MAFDAKAAASKYSLGLLAKKAEELSKKVSNLAISPAPAVSKPATTPAPVQNTSLKNLSVDMVKNPQNYSQYQAPAQNKYEGREYERTARTYGYGSGSEFDTSYKDALLNLKNSGGNYRPNFANTEQQQGYEAALKDYKNTTPVSAFTGTSVVDYLKSRGFTSKQGDKFPLYDFRKQLYDTLGLYDQYGDYRGDSTQNPVLLNYLMQAEKNAGVSITPENIMSVIRLPSKTNQATNLPSQSTEQPTQATYKEDSGYDLSSLFRTPSADEIANRAMEEVFGSASYNIRKEGADLEKEALQMEQQSKTETLLADMAKKGLSFSGIKEKGVKSVEAEYLSKVLNVDKRFSLLIAEGLESAAQRIAKEAQQGNKDALSSLRALGYDINPFTGRVEPTLATRKAEAADARAEAADMRAEEAALRSEKRLELAEKAAERADQQFGLSMAAAARAERATYLSEVRYANEQQRQEALAGGDALDYFNGTIPLNAVDSSRRGITTGIVRQNLLKREYNNVSDIENKLRVAKELKEPVEMTDHEMRMNAYDDLAKGTAYEEVINNLITYPLINPQRAKMIVDEVYGKIPDWEGANLGFGISESTSNSTASVPMDARFGSLFRF